MCWFRKEPPWVARLEGKIDFLATQNRNYQVQDSRRDQIIMAQVQIAQEDLDATATALRGLVDKVNELDLTPLPAADQAALVSAVADLTSAVNTATGENVEDVPAPNPEPEPTETPSEETGDDGSSPVGP
jgi:hypothetical protein